MIYHLKAIATGKIEDLPYSTKRPMRSALNKTLFTGKMWLSKTGFSDLRQPRGLRISLRDLTAHPDQRARQ